MRQVLMGNHAVSWGATLSRVQVIAAYPITPQTQVVELLSEICAEKKLDAKFIKVESEHSAMAACIGASMTGARAFTATSAQGLALMHEMLHWASGARTPVVMANINRAMTPPWTIWTDQNDSLSERDTGWMQVYCQNNQEVLDSVIQAYKVSERILLPTMVILDAFVLSHTMEVVDMPEQEMVDTYLPPFKPEYKLDPEDPHAFGGLTGPDGYFELRYIMQDAMEQAKSEWEKTGKETYKADDADFLIISSATIASTARVAVDRLRERGMKIGILRIRVFRPFPVERVREIVSSVKKAMVIDRNISFGASGIFYQEVKAAMYNVSNRPPIFGIVTGLGGRDVGVRDIIQMVEDVDKMDSPRSDIIFKGVRI